MPGERDNAHSHLLTALLSQPSLTLPVTAGALALGRWQRVMLAEFDGPRPDPVCPVREVELHIYDPARLAGCAGGG